MSEQIPDPFSSPEANGIMRELYVYYLGAMGAGFTEERAYGLVHDLFISQMSVVLNAALNANQQEG